MSVVAFKNVSQAAVWYNELLGQISDGMWENTRPYDHWKAWNRADVIVDAANPGRDFHAFKDNYNINSRMLLEIVDERMLFYARLALVPGVEFKVLREYERFLASDGTIKTILNEGKYYDDLREKMIALPLDKWGMELAQVKYTRKDLLKDLKEMKTIIKTMRK